MSERTLFVKNFEAPPINEQEIFRYMRAEKSAVPEKLLKECLNEALSRLSYKVCWREYSIERKNGELDLGFCQTRSLKLSKNLKCAEKIVLFAATIGIEADRMITAAGKLSPLKALVLDALCTERIESLCDLFNAEIKEQAAKAGENCFPRFSAGYGDLALCLQRDIITALDCTRKIGITLNDSLIMSPSKSVTGIIGIGKGGSNLSSGCADCEKKDCEFRRK